MSISCLYVYFAGGRWIWKYKMKTTDLVCLIIQAIFSVVQCAAEMMRSPSFSLFSSSMTTRNSPRLNASSASSINFNVSVVWVVYCARYTKSRRARVARTSRAEEAPLGRVRPIIRPRRMRHMVKAQKPVKHKSWNNVLLVLLLSLISLYKKTYPVEYDWPPPNKIFCQKSSRYRCPYGSSWTLIIMV